MGEMARSKNAALRVTVIGNQWNFRGWEVEKSREASSTVVRLDGNDGSMFGTPSKGYFRQNLPLKDKLLFT
jgi:hypothetical protein